MFLIVKKDRKLVKIFLISISKTRFKNTPEEVEKANL